MVEKTRWTSGLLVLLQLLCVGLYLVLGYWTPRENFLQVVVLLGALFGLALWTYSLVRDEKTLWALLCCGVGFRLLLLLVVPNLSDDVYRYLWDGRLWAAHRNPFDELPLFYSMNFSHLNIPGITAELHSQIYAGGIFYASYPPLAQLLFYGSTVFAPTNTMANIVTLKGIVFVFDMGVLWMLWKLLKFFKLPPKSVLLYALNPLLIVEIAGNAHFEPIMVFFVLSALWLLLHERWGWSAIVFGLSVSTKIFPLIFLPLLVRRIGWKRVIPYGLVVGVVCACCFAPLFWDWHIFQNYMLGLSRFFQKFEFNGSIYAFVRWLMKQTLGYNPVAITGRVMSLSIFCGVWILVFREKRPTWAHLPTMMLFALTIYFSFALVVHPWYLTTLVALSVLTHRRYALLWTLMIPLSYATYMVRPYQEHMGLVALQYAVVWGWLFAESKGWLQRIPWLRSLLYEGAPSTQTRESTSQEILSSPLQPHRT